MTKTEWKQIAPLLLAWPHRRGETIAHGVYESVLERFEPAQVADALRDLALTAKHMPTAAEVAHAIGGTSAATRKPPGMTRWESLPAETRERLERETREWKPRQQGGSA